MADGPAIQRFGAAGVPQPSLHMPVVALESDLDFDCFYDVKSCPGWMVPAPRIALHTLPEISAFIGIGQRLLS
jgi:hypothetical protein